MYVNKQPRTDRQRAVQTHPTNYHLQQPNQDTFLAGLSLFDKVTDQTPSGAATLAEIAERIKTCPQLKEATEGILKTHGEGILDGFKTVPKGSYQAQKTKTLPAVLPGGLINTRDGNNPDRLITPSGYICLDLDENSLPELTAFRDRIEKRNFKNAALCAYSVSGQLNGSMALFLKVNFPTSWKSTPQATRKALGLTKTQPWQDVLQKINEAYYQALSYLLKKTCGIGAGKAGKSIYNVRYLAHDPEAYFNPNATKFTLAELVAVLKEMEAESHVREASRTATNITATDAFAFAEAFAAAKGYELVEGQLHHYFNSLAIACNLLGVPQGEVEAFAEAKGVNVTTNCITYPYKAYRESFGRWEGKLQENENRLFFEGKEGQKLTDILTPEAALGKIVISPTGSGKTFFVDKTPGRKIIICPTLALVDNVVDEYPTAVPFTGSTRDTETIREADFIATTYASFGKLCESLTGLQEQFNAFIDESQAFTSSTSPGYQLKQLTEVLKKVKGFKSFTLLTGTDLYNHHPELRALDKVIVKLPATPKTFAFVEAEDTLKAAATRIKKSVAAGRFPLVLFNNKSKEGRLGTLQSLLSDTPGIRFFNADTKDDSEFKQITSKGVIAEGITGVVTTTVLKEGNNIYNEYDFDIIIVGAFHASAIQQFASRPRKPKSIHVTIIRSKRRKTSSSPFNAPETAVWLEKQTKAVCDELNTSDGLTVNQYQQELKARQAIKSRPLFFDKETRKYQVDFLALSNQVFNLQQKAQTRNDGLMIAALESYGMTYSGADSCTLEQTATEKSTAGKVRKAAREQQQEAYLAVLDELSQEEAPLGMAEAEIKTNAHNLTNVQRDVYSRFVALAKVCPNQEGIIQEMQAIGPKKAKFEVLLKRVKIAAARRDKGYLAKNRKFAIVLKAIDTEFKAGQRFTSNKIAAKIHNALALDRSLDLSYLEQDVRTDRYLKTARLFFDFVRKDSRNAEGGKVNKYEVCPLTFDHLFKIEPKVRVQNRPSLKTVNLCW